MSEIQRYMYARDGMVPDAEHLRGSGEPEFWVRFTDHEAERAENLATIDFLNKELRSAVDALADAKARIEDLHYGDDNLLIGTGYQLAVNDALAALTQPQTERCPEDCDGFGQLIGDSDGPCPACSGLEPDRGGAAAEKCPNPDCEGGTRPNGEGGWDMCPDCLEAANADGGGGDVQRGGARCTTSNARD